MSRDGERRTVADHILPTSANLLGICFVILSLLKVAGVADQTLLDEATGIAILLFLLSSFLSYASLRGLRRAEGLERVADYLFLAGLTTLAVIATVVVLRLIP